MTENVICHESDDMRIGPVGLSHSESSGRSSSKDSIIEMSELYISGPECVDIQHFGG